MARKLRYYEKKRGNRRTGSSAVGSAGELIFFAAFLLLGCGGLAVWFAFLVVPQWRVNQEFRQTNCRVVDARVKQKQSEDGTLFRPELKIEYEVDGQTYTSGWTYDITTARDFASSYSRDREAAEEVLGRFVGDGDGAATYPCWYDPADPRVAVLERGASWWIWLVLVIPASFVAIGGGGLIYRMLSWGKSAEHRAAVARRVSRHDPFKTNGASAGELPNIPDGSDITNSPGTQLRFRLPIATSAGWALFGVLLACLIFNGIVSIFVVIAIGGHLEGQPDWFLTLFIIPFVLVGIGLIVFFVRQLLVTTGVGPTRVEISSHPLRPGQQCKMFISQSGRLRINSIRVLLVCEEEATYRQGTNTRTETRRVHDQEVFRRDRFEVQRGTPFETECALQVPAGAMHSFKADHNQINWKVVVTGDVAGWPDYKRSFPVIIHPANGSSGP